MLTPCEKRLQQHLNCARRVQTSVRHQQHVVAVFNSWLKTDLMHFGLQ